MGPSIGFTSLRALPPASDRRGAARSCRPPSKRSGGRVGLTKYNRDVVIVLAAYRLYLNLLDQLPFSQGRTERIWEPRNIWFDGFATNRVNIGGRMFPRQDFQKPASGNAYGHDFLSVNGKRKVCARTEIKGLLLSLYRSVLRVENRWWQICQH